LSNIAEKGRSKTGSQDEHFEDDDDDCDGDFEEILRPDIDVSNLIEN
jgi:hypothetical protein